MHRKATLFSFTVVHSGTEAFKDRIPYVVALVEEGRQLCLARIVGYSEGRDIRIGTEVQFSGEDSEGQPIYRFI